ncbi:hypothetical protein [Embleya sp. NBC_00896]|uniref:hypothetical protein n=1 Tax=Embleya sp. NBC_00896 TaxID=2975961 RepID=UPI002F906AE8|nr:hypothetical protein OG928_40295 [Embleya sp. NBC_00896]
MSLSTVTMPVWWVGLEPAQHPTRRWVLAFVSADDVDPTRRVDHGAVHLTDDDAAALAETLLRPPRPDVPALGRARVVRDGAGLRMRLFVAATDAAGSLPAEPGAVLYIQDRHRQRLLDDLARHRPDLIPTSAPPEPRLCLDPMPVTGLDLDQVAELHDRLGRWLDSEGARAALADRAVARRARISAAGR